ncbi:MAG: hypothetical protein ACJAUP_002540 [Cellvibrionaceae bacterium]|jgi:hypothetical protein
MWLVAVSSAFGPFEVTWQTLPANYLHNAADADAEIENLELKRQQQRVDQYDFSSVLSLSPCFYK